MTVTLREQTDQDAPPRTFLLSLAFGTKSLPAFFTFRLVCPYASSSHGKCEMGSLLGVTCTSCVGSTYVSKGETIDDCVEYRVAEIGQKTEKDLIGSGLARRREKAPSRQRKVPWRRTRLDR